MEALLGFEEQTLVVDADDQAKSSSSRSYKLVPWLNWDEWEWVRDSLFSDSPDKIVSAIKENDLPSDAIHSEQMLAMLYCMAILRHEKKTEISIAEAAGAIGIPRTLIDIRHEGSHRDLPALTLVRDSAAKAIHWLKSYYWEPQTEQIPLKRDGTAEIRKEIKSKLRELASCLKVRQSSLPGSSLIRGKRGKREQLCGRNKFFSLMASKLNLSKSGGTYLASMEYRTGTDKIEQLSFLFAWLVGQLKLLKPFCHKRAKNKTEVFATETDMSNPILMEVLRKCLMISSCGNKQLMDSALHLAELMGNSHLMEKLTKLSCVCFSDLVVTEEIFSPKSSNNLLVQQDESIHQAANKLESVKLHLAKHKIEKTTDGDLGRAGRWSVVKSWNPCPIGMLPRDLGSSGCLPVLDHNDVSKKSVDSSERTQISVAKHSGAEEPSSSIQCDNPSAERRSKREASYDICLLDRSSFKKMRETVYTCDSDEDTLLPDDITSCLVINGVWKKVGEELRAIMSGVGTLV
ncbi:hypothetical protein GH714_042280 [Hevea brasiliensis]|uniref:Las1-like family protein n=1 Tax=Hevea brasiliensis TaxID=3981 RepID=A0A6A6KVF5_HEVBR|nr:hypothetical protein GH714_042280 [Hevea brasiliensis]